MDDFKVSCRTDGPVEVVVVEGELDLYNVPQVQQAINGCIDGGDAPVIADFSLVRFMDSTAMRLLMVTHNRMDAAGRSFQVVSESPQVLRLFELSGLGQMMPLRPTMAGAIAALD